MDLAVDCGEKLRVCSCPSGRMDSMEAAAKPASRSIAIDLDGNFIPDSGLGSFHIPEWRLGSRSAYVRSVHSVLPPGRNLADPFRNYTSGFSLCGVIRFSDLAPTNCRFRASLRRLQFYLPSRTSRSARQLDCTPLLCNCAGEADKTRGILT